MKILFLDIDGVLNAHGDAGMYNMSDARLRRLRRIVESTGCQIVLSSSWRRYDDLFHRAKTKLEYKGMKLYGCTPRHYDHDIRGKEIQEWLDAHPNVTKYAIVDDDSDMMDHQKPFYVKTNGEVGMTDDDADELIYILNDKEA